MEHLEGQLHPGCYPSRPAEALRFFRQALESATSASELPKAVALAGIVTPHIDLRVSLRSFAVAYQPLLHQPLADTYIILGVGHRSPLEWNLDSRDYVTPLGRVACAADLVKQLSAGPGRFSAPGAHLGEWSIEFAVIWLQAIHQLHGKPAPQFRFVPILCGGLHAYVEGFMEWDDLTEFHVLGERLRELFAKDVPGKNLRVIVSIDGCHIGPRFDDPFPVTSVLLKVIEGWEDKLWACAAKGDLRAFLDWFREEGNDRHFDGVGALALLMAAGKFSIERTFYEQWFTEQDASVVTFSSGLVLA